MANKRTHVEVSLQEQIILLQTYLENRCNWKSILESIKRNLDKLLTSAANLYRDAEFQKIKRRMSEQVRKVTKEGFSTTSPVLQRLVNEARLIDTRYCKPPGTDPTLRKDIPRKVIKLDAEIEQEVKNILLKGISTKSETERQERWGVERNMEKDDDRDSDGVEDCGREEGGYEMMKQGERYYGKKEERRETSGSIVEIEGVKVGERMEIMGRHSVVQDEDSDEEEQEGRWDVSRGKPVEKESSRLGVGERIEIMRRQIRRESGRQGNSTDESRRQVDEEVGIQQAKRETTRRRVVLQGGGEEGMNVMDGTENERQEVRNKELGIRKKVEREDGAHGKRRQVMARQEERGRDVHRRDEVRQRDDERDHRRDAIIVDENEEDDEVEPPPAKRKSTSEMAREAYEAYTKEVQLNRALATKMEKCMDKFLNM